jgi:hypothetical protein
MTTLVGTNSSLIYTLIDATFLTPHCKKGVLTCIWASHDQEHAARHVMSCLPYARTGSSAATDWHFYD